MTADTKACFFVCSFPSFVVRGNAFSNGHISGDIFNPAYTAAKASKLFVKGEDKIEEMLEDDEVSSWIEDRSVPGASMGGNDLGRSIVCGVGKIDLM